MKTAMRSFSLLLFFIFGVVFSGCYTEFAATEYENDEYYAGSDTTYDEEGNVTVNNNYYLDDDYRRSRFRLSFNYYYPTYHSSWIASYYYSYYDDPYWGWHRPHWYYNPWPYGCVYPPVVYWPPVYDPWYPYPHYPVVIYHSPYYPGPNYGYNPPADPGRVRTTGSTRDQRDPGERTRAIPAPTSPGATVVAGGTPTRERNPERKAATIDDRSRDKRAWWEKVNAAPQPEKRQRVTDGADRATTRKDRPVSTPRTNNAPRRDRKVDDGRQNNKPTYNPPKQTAPNNEGKKADRSRDNKRSYSPPPAQQAPAQSPPQRSNGGNSGSTNSGGERKRVR